jgi:hypothetical protein
MVILMSLITEGDRASSQAPIALIFLYHTVFKDSYLNVLHEMHGDLRAASAGYQSVCALVMNIVDRIARELLLFDSIY